MPTQYKLKPFQIYWEGCLPVGIAWSRWQSVSDNTDEAFEDYIYWFYWWNWLKPQYRYWGRHVMWYDGPHDSFGFWYFNWSWRLPWTSWKMEDD